MRCPNCKRIQRFTEKEKILTMQKGEIESFCHNCGTILVVHKYDVDPNEKRKHNKEVGICTQCGCRPAVEGLKTCEHCRELYGHKKKEVMSSGYFELFLRRDEPKKKENQYEIDELSKIAHDKGISYGDLVAIMEGRKKERKDLD